MPTDPLGVYLNDHLAGSVAALDMMQEVAERAKGQPLETMLLKLRAEVEEEQHVLRELLGRIDAEESTLKQAAAWAAEKLGAGKLALATRSHPALGTLQGLESILLGLQGKLALYRVLIDTAAHDARLSGYHFSRLESRTLDQQAAVERERLTAARAAFEGIRQDEAGGAPPS